MAEIIRTDKNACLSEIVGVGDHAPDWYDNDCPSCGDAPCGPHPDVLACKECEEDWPCTVAEAAAAELDRLVKQNRQWLSVSKGFLAAERAVHDYWTTKLTRRAFELRGGAS